ncbi:MAG TPA: hypothetical protein VKZ56_11155 [Membranihabitans sp.]|nr:hypothetical protein [Membranihabitans sp.]
MKEMALDPGFGLSSNHQGRLHGIARKLDSQGRLSKDALKIIIKNRHFHLFVPVEYGGMDLPLVQGMQIIESYARIEGNLGWLVQIGAGGGVFAAYMDADTAYRFLGDPSCVIAGSDFVGGFGEWEEGGFRVTGTWGYASGAGYATAFTGNIRIKNSDGEDEIRAVIVPSHQVEIIRNWNAMGMRATDSHSFRMENVFVPYNQLFSLDPADLRTSTRTTHLPFELYARALFMPVLTGIAYRYAQLIQDYLNIRKIGEETTGYQEFKRLWRMIDSGRRLLYDTVEQFEDNTSGSIVHQGSVNEQFRSICLKITRDLLNGMDNCHWMVGMKGVMMDDPLNIAYRNFKTVMAHRLLRP